MNPPKTNKVDILFICTANRDRSRTAELIFQTKYPEMRFRSAGINKYLSERHGGVHLKRYMLEVADRVICMEQCHFDYIVSQIDTNFRNKLETINLGDHEGFMTEAMKESLFKLIDVKPKTDA